MNIGNIKLENNILLAPMAGVADSTYRAICREMGAGLVFSEMISSKGLFYNDEKTKRLAEIDEREGPIALQIFGSDPDIMGEIVKIHLNPREDIDIIDINMGCPAPKIVRNGDGAALLQNPELVQKILKSVVRASNKPVTLKIRMGWNHGTVNGIEISKIAENEGISALTIHGRTRDMFYSGKADWDFIREVKNAIKIPVIGNGDIFEPIDAINMMDYTKCDGVAVGRGAMGNPWIFRRIKLLMDGKHDVKPSNQEKIDMAIKHLEMISDSKGEHVGVKEMRKHIAWYLKGMKGSSVIRNHINTIDSKAETIKTLEEYLSELN